MPTKEPRPAIRTLRGWALAVLREVGVIHEREEHGWANDRADPHARERPFDIARQDPPSGVSREEAAIELDEVLGRSATLAPNVRRDTERASGRKGSFCGAATCLVPEIVKPLTRFFLLAAPTAAA
jgi:hypothetical protein